MPTVSPTAILPTLTLGAALTALALTQDGRPHPTPLDAPTTTFSAERALQDVRELAREPHPVNTPAHTAAREYLLRRLRDLGLDPRVHEATAVGQRYTTTLIGRSLNVVALLPGTDPGPKALALTAHYDSVATGPGAADDAAGVATILEVVRAIQADQPLTHDVLVWITDSEEIGLMGARAAIQHPLWDRVGAVINLEARGNRGPSFMFQAVDPTGALLDAFHTHAPHPNASSLATSVYELMPNGTDLEVFRQRDTPGLNFAFIGNHPAYHTALDTPDNLSLRSVQDQGDAVLALTRHLGRTGLDDLDRTDTPHPTNYFVLPPGLFVRYPLPWTTAFLLLGAALWLRTVQLARRLHPPTHHGVLVGALLWPLCAALATLAVHGLALLALHLGARYRLLALGDTAGDGPLRIAFALTTLLLYAVPLHLAQRRWRIHDLALGALLPLGALATAAAIYLPGTAYAVLWPWLLTTLGWHLSLRHRSHWPLLPALIVSALILVPTLEGVFLGMTLGLSALAAPVAALLAATWAPALTHPRGTLPRATLTLALTSYALGAWACAHDPDPTPVSLFYTLDADTQTAHFATTSRPPNPWLTDYVPDDTAPDDLGDFWEPIRPLPLRLATAPALDLPAPALHITSQTTAPDGTRVVHLRIRAPQRASLFAFTLPPGSLTPNATAHVDNLPVDTNLLIHTHHEGFTFVAPPDRSLELTLPLSSPSVSARLLSITYGLSPDLASPRPPAYIPSPAFWWIQDAHLVAITRDL